MTCKDSIATSNSNASGVRQSAHEVPHKPSQLSHYANTILYTATVAHRLLRSPSTLVGMIHLRRRLSSTT